MKLIKKLDMRSFKPGGRLHRWALFYCDYCNKEVEKSYINGLRDKSCGCVKDKLAGEMCVIHGDAKNKRNTKLYRVWCGIKQRCYNQNDYHYKWYGGRGITICKKWKNSYINFKEWALKNGYNEKLEIDREENNNNYEPSNCRWVTHVVNGRNKRSTKLDLNKANNIRDMYTSNKFTQAKLGIMFNVNRSTIGYIINNKIWKNNVAKNI